jgi:NTP pyrophosphatase (non-canonical NTP hydrolase)
MEELSHDQTVRMSMLEKLISTKSYEVEQECLITLINKVTQWHHDRNLINGSTDKDQTLKLLQELGELSDSVCKGKDIKDDIGDMLVVMINIVERNKLSLVECLECAWNDIKNRKGKMVDGIFVKEGD